MIEKIIEYIAIFLALIIVLPCHEFAHAYVADKFGDSTPRLNGRLTLNPIAHFDLFGILSLIFVHFGWGKPVPINPNNFRKRRLGCFCVSIAGVLTNYILAFLIYPLLILFIKGLSTGSIPDLALFDVVIYTLTYAFKLNLFLFAFNILPLYPLDGFNLFESLNTTRGSIYRFLRNYGQYILLGLVLLGIMSDITNIEQLDLLGYALNWIANYLQYPITLFWGLIL